VTDGSQYHILRVLVLHGITSVWKVADDLPVGPGIADGVNRLAHALHAPFRVGKCASFSQSLRGQDSARAPRLVMKMSVHQQIEMLQFFLHLLASASEAGGFSRGRRGLVILPSPIAFIISVSGKPPFRREARPHLLKFLLCCLVINALDTPCRRSQPPTSQAPCDIILPAKDLR